MKTILNVFLIQWAMSCNRFIYWCRRIPLIGKHIPDALYAGTEGKTALMAVITAFKAIYAFLGKFLYLFLACALPYMIISEGGAPAQGWPYFVCIFFWMSFVAGTLLQPDLLAATLLKYTCVRQMGLNARLCVAATTGKFHVVAFVTFTAALTAASALFGLGPLLGLLLSLELAALRLAVERAALWLFDRTGKLCFRNPWFVMLVVMGALVPAYLPLLLESPPPVALLFHPVTAVLLLALGGLSLVSLLRYKDYRGLMVRTCRPEYITTAAAKQNAAKAAFKDVQLKESDLDPADGQSEAVSRLSGYEYLNALFFRRHRRLLTKPVKYELAAVAALFVLLLVLRLLFPAPMMKAFAAIPGTLPFFVFVMYLLSNTLGSRICKAMFYNCDISLLRFGWYRQRKVVLHNFAIRLWRVTRLNLLVAGALCLAAFLLTASALPPAQWLPLAPWIFAVFFLAIFFSVHPLFMYYIFQPYSSELAVKNPFFNIINVAVYILSYACIQIHETPGWFAFLVLGATILYSAVALLVVWLQAPRRFRVK